jgi:peptidoglycan/xylan/chitin deacetylase (PgdA/CDA1 family)
LGNKPGAVIQHDVGRGETHAYPLLKRRNAPGTFRVTALRE